MTPLRKRVVRLTAEKCPYLRRHIVIALEPGDILAMREKGRRRWYYAPISRIFGVVARWNVDAERIGKRSKKRGGK